MARDRCIFIATAAPIATPTLQPLHSVQLGEELIDHPVRDPRAVVAPPGRQGVKLVKEQDAGLGGLSPGARQRVKEVIPHSRLLS